MRNLCSTWNTESGSGGAAWHRRLLEARTQLRAGNVLGCVGSGVEIGVEIGGAGSALTGPTGQEGAGICLQVSLFLILTRGHAH